MEEHNIRPLVSVVVPVYNVEPYLKQCIESILTQDYHDLEIIIVDDGSTDNSAGICDEFSKKDSRIVVIHQTNRGLSAARNEGLKYARGEYITFVDSDDWIDTSMIEHCMEKILSSHAEACGTSFNLVYDEAIIQNRTKAKNVEVYNTEQGLSKYLFNTNLSVCVCGKIWKRELWTNVRCPEGKLHEDQFTTYKLISKCYQIVFSPEPLYYYRQRAGSIGHSKFTLRSYDLIDGIDVQYEYISQYFPQIEPKYSAACAFWYTVFVNMMIKSDSMDRKAAKKCQRFVRKHIYQIILSEDLMPIRKIQLGLFSCSLVLYMVTYRIFLKKQGIR